MDAPDLTLFGDWFDVLAVTHRLSAPEDIRSRMKAEYFDVLRPFPMASVEVAYQNLRRKMKKWPVPADWLEALPPFRSTATLPLLTDEERARTEDAEALGYEATAICKCALCVHAGCFLPPRYVPIADRDGNPLQKQHPTRPGVPVILGRWLHGEELKRWYGKRAEFYLLKHQLFGTSALPEVS